MERTQFHNEVPICAMGKAYAHGSNTAPNGLVLSLCRRQHTHRISTQDVQTKHRHSSPETGVSAHVFNECSELICAVLNQHLSSSILREANMCMLCVCVCVSKKASIPEYMCLF